MCERVRACVLCVCVCVRADVVHVCESGGGCLLLVTSPEKAFEQLCGLWINNFYHFDIFLHFAEKNNFAFCSR